MSYIICGDSKNTSEPAAKRAYTLQDILKPDSGLKPDIEYYLVKQIFPPIERLCAPISGTDSVRLAECLGLDTRKYQINAAGSYGRQDSSEIFPLESQIPDEVRFKDATRFTLTCLSCKTRSVFEGLAASSRMCTPSGIVCPNETCKAPFTTLTLAAQLETAIRAHTARYYEAWLICDDPSCGNRTRQISVYGHRCLGPRGLATGCLGRMQYEYGEKALYNQLLYYAGLWDVEKAKKEVEKVVAGKIEDEEREERERVKALVEFNRGRFGNLKGVVEGYLRKCGRQWVDLGQVFGFALR